MRIIRWYEIYERGFPGRKVEVNTHSVIGQPVRRRVF